jgi:hypothetical protein
VAALGGDVVEPGRPKRILQNLALVVVSSALACYAVEAFLVLTLPGNHADRRRCAWVSEPAKCLAALAARQPFDTRSKLDVIRDLDAEGIEAWPSVSSTAVQEASTGARRMLLPFGGMSRVTTVYCNESGRYVVFSSDEHGFRNPGYLYDATPSAVVLGDSFARGYCVDTDIATTLREVLGTVLDLGVDDAGPLVQLAVLREIAAPLKPATVLWLFFEGNDLQDLEREQADAGLRRYLGPEHRLGLMTRQSEIDETIRSFVRRGARLNAAPRDVPAPAPVASFLRLGSLRQRLRRAAGAPARRYPFDASTFRDILVRARDETRDWGGEIVFVYLPAWERFDGGRANPHRDRILNVVEELVIPVVDVQAAFAVHPDPLSLFPFRLRGHYTEEGYALVAEAILRDVGSPRRRPPPVSRN